MVLKGTPRAPAPECMDITGAPVPLCMATGLSVMACSGWVMDPMPECMARASAEHRASMAPASVLRGYMAAAMAQGLRWEEAIPATAMEATSPALRGSPYTG